uniref:RING-type domain-containing protein n=1 Tax=Clytia hemisphaerica TaxID=252671 RepID=A0A7M5XLC1_9CNID
MEVTFKERIEELLVCAICYDCLKQPKTLDCGHMFCRICLESHAIKSEWKIRCPTCRQEQNSIKRFSCIAQLDAPLYIKQALELIHTYKDNDYPEEEDDISDDDSNTMKENNQPEPNGVSYLLEHCYICDEDGHWLNSCPQNDEVKSHDNEKLKNEDDSERELRVELPEEQLVDFKTDSHKDEHSSGRRAAHEPYDDFILTQEFTFDKICKKAYKRLKKQKKKLIGGDDDRKGDTKKDSKKSLATVFSERYLKYQRQQVDLPEYDSKTPGLSKTHLKDASSPGGISSKSSSNSSAAKKPTSKSMTAAASATGSKYRPSYVPGSLNKTHKSYTMMGYGLPLSGQFGQRQGPRRRQHQQTASSEQSGSSGCSIDDGSSQFQGAFGKNPFSCSGTKPKVFVALKF